MRSVNNENNPGVIPLTAQQLAYEGFHSILIEPDLLPRHSTNLPVIPTFHHPIKSPPLKNEFKTSST